MILSKLTVQGFKSFAKRVDLKFDGKITAVVGPNGCGKTNIVDAIRWGLGEQRPSILRTDRMENVIFGGAQSSKPLGMAEVSITFDNTDQLLPIDYSEVTITRRLYRSGESEYLINKNRVRLKDINDLIMDTGIGADAYSVIELKMIEDILSDRAEDRRRLMEEAAGVTKYKHRLRAAMRKLDATQNDLLRVNDIISEVERSVASLKRQVGRARRYKEYQELVQELEIKTSSHIYTNLKKEIEPLQKELEQLKQQKDGSSTEITKEEADLESIRLTLTEQERDLVRIRESMSQLIETIHKRESDIRVGKERASSLRERITRYSREIEDLKKRLEDQENHLVVTGRNREVLQVKITSSSRIFENKKKELEVFQQGLNLKRLTLNDKKKAVIECLEQINSLSSSETNLQTKIDNFQGRMERLDEEDQKYRSILKSSESQSGKVRSIIDSLNSEYSGLKDHFESLRNDEKRLISEIDKLRERFFDSRSRLELIEGRLDFYKNMLDNQEGVSDGAKWLIKQNTPGLIGILADLINVKNEYKQAVSAGLGEASGYILVERMSQAFVALEKLKQRGGGRASIISLDSAGKAPVMSKVKIKNPDKIIGWAHELVTYDKKIEPVVKYLLNDLVIVEDIESARELIDNNDLQGIRVATLDGEVVSTWGSLQVNDTRDKEHSLIGRMHRIEELEKEAGSIKKKVEELKKQIEEKEKHIEKTREMLSKSEQEAYLLQDKIKKNEYEFSQIEFETKKADDGIKANADERQKLLKEIETSKAAIEDIRPQIEALMEKREKIDLESARIQSEIERLEEEEHTKEEDVHKLNLGLVRLKGEAKNLDYDIERSKNLIEEIRNTIEQRFSEINESEKEIEELEKSREDTGKLLEQNFAEKDEKDKLLEQSEAKYQELQQELQQKEREVREVRRGREQIAETLHSLELRIAELSHDMKNIKERIMESYEIDIEKVKPDENLDVEKAEEEVVELKRKMKGLGAVNLMALVEYDEQKERLDFLVQQREDLLSAEETLNETIKKINRTARTRFTEVFSEVRKNFKDTFGRFFQGGEADLRLPEGEDPLEAQIEILARPSGKHSRDLSLLSGGERALTAISLLFALYLVKPSPFCILDEIDAPLDDANVERFTRVLKEFAEKTQFIIVTHNRMTMKAAQALYGVTMEEKGVSKIVSVKFDDRVPAEA
ncbi:chromosome segregation protein SMC [candidate division KSB1 bacterium]|nr:MAG: chromosome segregation protein SMC [candidate division KSB1 bacterium]